jgi:hypothetical protein
MDSNLTLSLTILAIFTALCGHKLRRGVTVPDSQPSTNHPSPPIAEPAPGVPTTILPPAAQIPSTQSPRQSLPECVGETLIYLWNLATLVIQDPIFLGFCALCMLFQITYYYFTARKSKQISQAPIPGEGAFRFLQWRRKETKKTDYDKGGRRYIEAAIF